MLPFGRALRAGLVGLAAPLVAVTLAAPRRAAALESRSEGRIAFAFGESGADRPAQLAVMDANGKNWHALRPFGVGGLSWSPDGRLIAFAYGTVSGDVMFINPDDPRTERLVVRNGANPAWSPSGRSIAFERGGDIWVFDLRKRRQSRIVRHGRSPSWSADDRKLAFARGSEWGQGPKAPELWVLAGKKERRLVRNGDSAEWSPDGQQIAFERCRDLGYDLKCFIYVTRSDGTKLHRLFEGEQPTWSPTGREIAFIGTAERRPYADAVIRARLDGTGRRVVFGQRPYCGCEAPEWGPRRHGGHR